MIPAKNSCVATRLVAVAVMVWLAGCAGGARPAPPETPVNAQTQLVGAILAAEDARDALHPALATGEASADPAIRMLATRARQRIVDPKYVERTSLPPLSPPPAWPEPAWRLRYRALADAKAQCDRMAQALADESWPVRLRAADVVEPSCGSDPAVTDALTEMLDLPADLAQHAAGGVSWHGAAHALVGLARVQPATASARLAGFATHSEWHLRLYAARAAVVLKDTATLERLAGDADANVAAAALDGLSKLGGHAHDALYLAALESGKVQTTRVAAEALVGTAASDANARLTQALQAWTARSNASERDVRVAILKALGQPPEADRPPTARSAPPPDATALAMGARRDLEVTMSPASGGGRFVVHLRGDIAPIMAARILQLASDGYYDGLSWHRVEHDFVIQGGSPGDDEYVGYREYLRDELGTVPHVRGTVGMSTRGHDTGDAQWFINLRDNRRLDPTYTVFGEVVEGMDVVDGVMEGDVMERVRPVPAKTSEGGF